MPRSVREPQRRALHSDSWNCGAASGDIWQRPGMSKHERLAVPL